MQGRTVRAQQQEQEIIRTEGQFAVTLTENQKDYATLTYKQHSRKSLLISKLKQCLNNGKSTALNIFNNS